MEKSEYKMSRVDRNCVESYEKRDIVLNYIWSKQAKRSINKVAMVKTAK